jgi:hypothetical protein
MLTRLAFNSTIVLPRFNRSSIKLLIQLFVVSSALFGFWTMYNVYSYMPWSHRILKALEMALLSHIGLWLATLEIQSRWRFFVALLLIPSAVGVYFLLWHRSIFTVIAAPLTLSWLLNKVLRGKKL